jgi:hypothetical protein
MIGTYMGTPGLNTGLKDRNGVEVHLGDTLSFDPKEWGSEFVWVLAFEDGELNGCSAVTTDIPEWCDVIKKWDAE